MLAAFLDSIWAVMLYPLTLVLLGWLGGRYAHYRYRLQRRNWLITGMESGIIGLFGLLLSFTLSASGNSVQTRNAAVHQEVTNLLKAYRHARLADPALRRPLARYLQVVLGEQLRQPTPTRAQCRQLLAGLAQASDTLDQQLTAYVAHNPAGQPAADALLERSTDLNATLRTLYYSFQQRTAPPILLALVLLSWISTFLIGFLNQFQTRPGWLLPLVFGGTTLILMAAIHDLDDPSRGIVVPDYQDLYRTRQQLFDAPPAAPLPASLRP